MAGRPLSVPHLVASREQQTSWLRRDLDLRRRRCSAGDERRAAACSWNWKGLVWGRLGKMVEAEEEEGTAAAAAMNAIGLNSEAASKMKMMDTGRLARKQGEAETRGRRSSC